MKKKIFDCILKVVSEATEVSQEMILGRDRTTDVVEARCMVMYFSDRYGLSRSYLQNKFQRKSKLSVSKLINCFECYTKSSFAFQQATNEIKMILQEQINNN